MTAIEWTNRTWPSETYMVDRDGRRTRVYHRKTTAGPGKQERNRMRALGLRWCSRCNLWLASHLGPRGGLCYDHKNELYREIYASDGGVIRRRHVARKRGVAPLPAIAVEVLTEEFGGVCAYCPAPATTYDHIVPVSVGGQTERTNIVPACVSCNSSKGASDLDEWLERRGRRIDPDSPLADVLILAVAA